MRTLNGLIAFSVLLALAVFVISLKAYSRGPLCTRWEQTLFLMPVMVGDVTIMQTHWLDTCVEWK